MEELKESAKAVIDHINDKVDDLQARIVDINVIHNYLQYDQDLMIKYSGQIGELFGKVNALTRIVDEMTLNVHDVISEGYDHYPSEVVASFVMLWDMQSSSSLDEIEEHIEQLERYIEYFKAINENSGLEVEYLSNPTVH